jgi:hypothetical protein
MNGRDISSSRLKPRVRSHAGLSRAKYPLKSSWQSRSAETAKAWVDRVDAG